MTIQVRAPVLRNVRLSESTWRLSMAAPTVAARAAAGQFVTLRVSLRHDPLLRRPFGVHRVDEVAPGALDILYRVVGKGTAEMTRLRPDETVDLLGPIGRGFGRFPERRHHLLVAGGIGVAPFPLLARRIREEGGEDVRLFFGGKSASDLAGAEDVARFCREVVLVTEDGSRGRKGLVTDPLREALLAIGPGDAVVYACGPLPMLAAVARLAATHGVRCEVSLESQMACGMGTCMGCVTRTIPVDEAGRGVGVPATCDPCAEGGVQECYQRICHDGPVFDAREIVWEA